MRGYIEWNRRIRNTSNYWIGCGRNSRAEPTPGYAPCAQPGYDVVTKELTPGYALRAQPGYDVVTKEPTPGYALCAQPGYDVVTKVVLAG